MSKRALSALALYLCAGQASSRGTDPYFEYQVWVPGYPTVYFTDVNEAASVLLSRDCERSSNRDCVLDKIWYMNSIYIVDHWYTNQFGDRYHGSATGYRYYTCDTSPSLYIVHGDDARGPYANRTIAPPHLGSDIYCLGSSPETETQYQSDLGNGDCLTRPHAGNPISVGVNNKHQQVVDIADTGGSPLIWSRYYNSGVVADGKWTVPTTARLGSRWRSTYDRSLDVVDTKAEARVRLHRHTGERVDFIEADGGYRSDVDPRGHLSREGSGRIYRSAAGESEVYDANGRLVAIDPGTSRHVRLEYDGASQLTSVEDLQGRRLTVIYDGAGRVASVRDGDGAAVSYIYSEGAEPGRKADLVRATYADGTFHEYTYNEAGFAGGNHPHVLTGIYDETKRRFATFRYDSEGRAIASEHIDGVGKVQLVREADGAIAVTGPMGAVHRYRYTDVRGSRRLAGVDQPGGAGCAAASSALEYHPDGTVSRRTDFDGKVTTYRYDADGQEIERREADGTADARRILTEWHPVLRRPVRITAPGREERLSYDYAGNLTGREVRAAIDPTQPGAPLTLSREWRWIYDASGRLLREEGPRSDTDAIATLAIHTYRDADAPGCATGPCDYRKGDRWKTENALGHVEEILSYDAAGRVRSRKDVHGTLFTYTYHPRGWLEEVKEARPGGVVAVTAFTYTARGEIASVTDADGVTLSFTYDSAGRLTEVSNPSKHRLRFQLDKAGNRTAEETYDMFLRTQLTRTFDALGRIETETREGAVTRYTYDPLGRPTGTTDADGRTDSASYDALGRLREAIRDVGGIEAASKVTHDPLDQLTSVEDPKGLTTRYLATGLGDVGSVDSPDGGARIDEHDAAGLLARHEGAGGVGSFRVTRDALGRPTLVHYDGGIEARYAYDVADSACPADQRHALGRLASMTQGDSRTVYCYDAPGNVTRKIQRWAATTTGVSYRYSKAGRLEEAAVDGGARATYRYDADGSVAGVSVEAAGQPKADLITSVAYRPFDLIESWRYGNGAELHASRDKSGRVRAWSGIDPDNSVYALSYTPGGEVETQAALAYGFRFGHNGLGYLDAVKDRNSTPLRAFEYDSAGDRIAMTTGGLRQTYLYDPASHRLTTAGGKSRRYDAAGNTIGIGDATLNYDATGRLASASEQGRLLVSYGYDAAGQRMMRTESGRPTALWLYDEHGRWLADYDASGRVIRQAVWMGDYLVGLVEGTKLYYVEPDHLGTPRAVIDPVRNVTVWRWRPSDDPFGTTPPDEDPDSDGSAFVFDLRFPGQRYDAVTGLQYNYRRDYDPESGRYIQVDPIGLAGGINPYLYANASPLRYTDPTGTNPWLLPVITAAVGAVGGAVGDTAAQLLGMYRSGWCADFNWRQLGISTASGAIAGLALPFAVRPGMSRITAAGRAAGIGGAVNVGAYLANGGSSSDTTGLAWAVGTGVAGGLVGGPVKPYSGYGTAGTAASPEMVRASSRAASVRLNTGASSIIRGLAAGGPPAVPMPIGSSSSPCGCNQ
jgi:RHS repeat-associated protein